MRITGCLFGVMVFGALCVGVSNGQQIGKDLEKGTCGGHPIQVVNGNPVSCVDIIVPFVQDEADSWYGGNLDIERNDAWIANQKSIAVEKFLTPSNGVYDYKGLAKAVREMKKAADDLCKRVKCGAKKGND